MRKSVYIAAALALVANGEVSALEGRIAPMWADTERGWHFYEAPPPPPQRKPEEEPYPAEGAGSGPAPLSSAWIRENLQTYMDRALDDPTPENVETYMLLQRLAMDKSQRFAEVTQQAVALNPVLDERIGMGGSSAERSLSRSAADEARRGVLARLSQEIGIWYFFRSDCPFCMRQDPSLLRLTNETGIQILPISTDGPPLASGAFPEYVVDGGQAAQLGVQRTPTLVVSHPETGSLTVLFDGLAMLDEIEKRLVDLAFAKGWITRSEFDLATRGGGANYIDPRAIQASARLEDVVKDPVLLLNHLREAAVRRQTETSPR
ncbi:MAG: hypothetical protein DDT34_01290 [Firmicutes bacterium]|nr:hypothetical protein [Bacillota bacterium]